MKWIDERVMINDRIEKVCKGESVPREGIKVFQKKNRGKHTG